MLARLAPRDRLRRQLRRLRATYRLAAENVCLPGPYFIKAGYSERVEPEYDHEENWGDVAWQPDVYPRAAELARFYGATRIVDIGCGNGAKLAPLRPEFETIGLDFGPNLEVCRSRYPDAEWIEHDLDDERPLPNATGAVLVCADVIEHVISPERLLRKLREALIEAHVLLLTTPERDLHWGPDHMGPPPNRAHVREWSWHEFRALLACQGFSGSLELTRSREVPPIRNTILATLS